MGLNQATPPRAPVGDDAPAGARGGRGPRDLLALLGPRRSLVWLAWASIVGNVGIVVTGGAVRLTGSGLGCPTWPRCTEESFVPHAEMGIHGVIEFGNRLLTFVLVAIAVATLLAVWRSRRPGIRWIAVVLALGIPAQAVVGGITVLTDLNPWLVAVHLLLSMAMISLAVLLRWRVDRPATPPGGARPLTALAWCLYLVSWVTLYLGTVVTGSGPHAGDANSPRNGLDPAAMTQLHADAVFLYLGLAVGLLLAVRAVGGSRGALRACWVLLGALLAQGLVGFVQYATDLPELLVGLHLLGAAVLAGLATWVLLAVRETTPALGPREATDGAGEPLGASA